MVQLRASPMRIVASMAARLATGRLPGRPRQTGHTWVLGVAPNSVGQPQNIFVRVPSSTCVSSPMTGSKLAVTSARSGGAVVVTDTRLAAGPVPVLPGFPIRAIGYPRPEREETGDAIPVPQGVP